MKKFTKYDVADIVLLYIGMTFLMKFLMGIVSIASFIGMKETVGMEKGAMITLEIAYLIIHGVVTCLLIFRRRFLINLFLPENRDAQIEVSDGLFVLTRYSFWIRLLGIMTFLSSGISIVSRVTSDLVQSSPIDFGPVWWVQSGAPLVSAIAGFLIIWKANWIAEKLERFGASGNQI